MASCPTSHTVLATAITLMVASFAATAQPKVRLGSDVLVSRDLHLVQGRRVGLITNHTGKLSSGEPLVDVLLARGVQVTALFGPEHGIRGSAGAGETVGDSKDPGTGIPVYSLYGPTKKPTPEMLKTVDVLVYDIQDVGARFYTYISTLKLTMEAAAEAGIPFIVLDRPNPLGRAIDGPIMEDSLQSFVGMAPLPVVYGLTCGELATVMYARGWLTTQRTLDLHVVEMDGWRPEMSWKETGLTWIAPSPNIPLPETADVYPGTCIIEATNLSEGRGTSMPFLAIGGPFVVAADVARELNAAGLPGVRFDTVTFTPVSSKWVGELCRGISIRVEDRSVLQRVLIGIAIVETFQRMYPDNVQLRQQSFNRLMGSAAVYEDVRKGVAARRICERWRASLQEYMQWISPFYRY